MSFEKSSGKRKKRAGSGPAPENDIIGSLSEMEERIQRLVEENRRLRERILSEKKTDHAPETFDGWSVSFSRNGYYVLEKEMDGNPRSLHIGREWNAEKAREKIAECEDFPRMVLFARTAGRGNPIFFCSHDCCEKAGYAEMETGWMKYDDRLEPVCACCGRSFF